jgi:hypothetical protein
MEKLSRRTALKGLGVLAGGIGASSAGIAIAGEAGAVPLSAVEGTRALTLHGSGLRTVGRSGRTSGDQVLLRGDLSFRVGGGHRREFLFHRNAARHARPFPSVRREPGGPDILIARREDSRYRRH